MSEQKTFIDTAQARLDELGREIETLEAHAKSAAEDAQTWANGETQALREAWGKAVNHLRQMIASEEANAMAQWHESKAEAERHWLALQEALRTYREVANGDSAPAQSTNPDVASPGEENSR